MMSRSFQTAEWYSNVCPTIATSPRWAAVSTMARAASRVVARGFSTMTCLPARSDSIASGAWVLGGVAITTASTESSA